MIFCEYRAGWRIRCRKSPSADGEDLTIGFPSEIVKAAKLSSGQQLDISARREHCHPSYNPAFTLELFHGKSPGWRAIAGAFGWGPMST
jgi:hypothetical protein